jgi:hypothetical protein
MRYKIMVRDYNLSVWFGYRNVVAAPIPGMHAMEFGQAIKLADHLRKSDALAGDISDVWVVPA